MQAEAKISPLFLCHNLNDFMEESFTNFSGGLIISHEVIKF